MISEHKPDGGKPLHVTRVCVKRGRELGGDAELSDGSGGNLGTTRPALASPKIVMNLSAARKSVLSRLRRARLTSIVSRFLLTVSGEAPQL